MTTAALAETENMAKKAPKTTPVRLTDEAIKWARIASGYTGESMSEYLSRIAVERGQEDSDRLHAQINREKTPKGKGAAKP